MIAHMQLALFLIAILVLVVALPIALLVWVSSIGRTQKELESRLVNLEQQLSELRQSPQTSRSAPSRTQAEPLATVQVATTTAEPAVQPPPVIPRQTFQEKTEPDFVPVESTIAPSVMKDGRVGEQTISESIAAQETSSALEPPVAPVPPATSTPDPKSPAFNWEQFIGVKLWAWIGGMAAFLGIAFLLKYSFEHDLIPPEVRVATGFLAGIGLVGGGLLLSRRNYAVLAQTLCATGVVVLYAVTFASHSVYQFALFNAFRTFLLMAIVTAGAFYMAARLNGMVIAILGMLGGFLTPMLLSTGVDRPLALFGYIGLLDIGLIAVAFNRHWRFLVLFAALGTALIQIGWAHEFFEPAKVYIAMGVCLGFCAFFLGMAAFGRRRDSEENWSPAAVCLAAAVSLGFGCYLLSSFAAQPGIVFTFVISADACVLVLVCLYPRLVAAQLVSGTLVFLVLAVWMASFVNQTLLPWALGLAIAFALLHSGFPFLMRSRIGESSLGWARLFPAAALLLMLVPILKLPDVSVLLWLCILLLDLAALAIAVALGSILSLALALALTLGAAALWILTVPVTSASLLELLVISGAIAFFFFGAGLFTAKKLGCISRPERGELAAVVASRAHIPAMSALLPFVLLLIILERLPLPNPSPVFGVGLFLVVLLLALTWIARIAWLPAFGLAGALLIEHVWHLRQFQTEHAAAALGWYFCFLGVLAVFPFVFWRRFQEETGPWAIGALSAPLHFYLIHRSVIEAYPNRWMGLLPASFALLSYGAFAFLRRSIRLENPKRISLLAWWGGSALFFVTLIFPVQFEREWITLGWALEGVALIWFYHRVPHNGLRLTGTVLLLIAFTRLALNPAVLSYHARSDTPILNWYLYAYLTVAGSLFAGARLLAPPRNVVQGTNVPPLLNALAIVLLFLLLNIEIADYFSEGITLTFRFSGNFARDMSYTVGWALFAFGLLWIGISRQLRSLRFASLGLLGVTLLKLFLHDLAHLPQLYRVGALITVAAILMIASWLYQRFLSRTDSAQKGPSIGQKT